MTEFFALLLAPTPLLPSNWAMHAYLAAGWAVVLAAMGAWAVRRFPLRARAAVAAALALWACAAGEASPTFWLGLAFNAPSLSGVLIGGYALARILFRSDANSSARTPSGLRGRAPVGLALAAVLLGYALLLDTLALLPVQLYAWGFSPLAVALLLAASLLPWAASANGGAPRLMAAPSTTSGQWMAPVALALFVLTRLPSGNVWDAVLDPITWLGLQIYLVRLALKARAQ